MVPFEVFVADEDENDKKKDRKCGNCKACFTAEFWLGADKTKNLPLYDAEISIFATIFAWKGTVLPMVLWKPLFWFQIIFKNLNPIVLCLFMKLVCQLRSKVLL